MQNENILKFLYSRLENLLILSVSDSESEESEEMVTTTAESELSTIESETTSIKGKNLRESKLLSNSDNLNKYLLSSKQLNFRCYLLVFQLVRTTTRKSED